MDEGDHVQVPVDVPAFVSLNALRAAQRFMRKQLLLQLLFSFFHSILCIPARVDSYFSKTVCLVACCGHFPVQRLHLLVKKDAAVKRCLLPLDTLAYDFLNAPRRCNHGL